MESINKTCIWCDKQFKIFPEDKAMYDAMDLPMPDKCHICRWKRGLAFWSFGKFRKIKSDLSGKTIITSLSEMNLSPIYARDEWASDSWNPMEYGRDYDFSRPFFEQFKALSDVVPKPAKSSLKMGINSEYSNNCLGLKNCYLIFFSGNCEDCAYGNAINHCNNCFDNTSVHDSEFSYECFHTARCSRIFFSKSVPDCRDIWFSKNLRNCSYCFGCANLKDKSYYIFNEPYSKEDYFKKLSAFNFGSYKFIQDMIKKTSEFWTKYPYRYMSKGLKSIDVSGEYIHQSKNVKKSYLVVEGEDLKYCQYLIRPNAKNIYDHLVYAENTSLSYECAVVGDAYNTRFCLQSWGEISNCEYCEYVIGGASLFACVGLRKKQYCIFNKQYSAEEFKTLREKIIHHMDEMPYIDKAKRVYRYGEFFPIEFSPFGYNETIAQEHFPLTEAQIKERGYNWRAPEIKDHKPSIMAEDLPDHIKDVDESILKETICCLHGFSANVPRQTASQSQSPRQSASICNSSQFR